MEDIAFDDPHESGDELNEETFGTGLDSGDEGDAQGESRSSKKKLKRTCRAHTLGRTAASSASQAGHQRRQPAPSCAARQ